MKEIVMDTLPGDHIKHLSLKALKMAQKKKCIVRFDFNDVKCLINAETNLDAFWRDRGNAHMMGWTTVGPNCPLEYEVETEIAICVKHLERAFRRKWNMETYANK